MKVFVVSLKRAAERREYITAHLDALQMDYEIIDAVDYQQMSPDDFATLTDGKAVSENIYLTKGVLACALSHVKIYTKIVEDDLDKVLVIEDDAILPKDIKSLLAGIEKIIGEDEVITLSYFSHFGNDIYLSKQEVTSVNKNYNLLYPANLQQIGSTMAYVITKKVAQKLPGLILPVSVAADYWGTFYNRGGFTSFRCVYPLPVKPALFPSIIDYPDAKTFKSKLAAWVRRNKIPMLTSYLNKRSQNLIDQKYIFHLVEDVPFNRQIQTQVNPQVEKLKPK